MGTGGAGAVAQAAVVHLVRDFADCAMLDVEGGRPSRIGQAIGSRDRPVELDAAIARRSVRPLDKTARTPSTNTQQIFRVHFLDTVANTDKLRKGALRAGDNTVETILLHLNPPCPTTSANKVSGWPHTIRHLM
ncbi:hypothetical protein L288_00450 [Sphingobium quisquiliarum P25]|uniref:Uncharacterized protein n=1 Tax=Sphingobium quisquiliarum P25 TaxID=1329909 RepID=T0HSC8_9SPHN|nr:hypothetical protein L288_00450 [Sphingobium quisquiliarum P25]